MSETISNREKIHALYRVASYRPALTTSIVLLSLLVAVLEGFGLGFIIPIIEIAQDNTDQMSDMARLFRDIYTLLGIPFSLEFIIVGISFVIGLRYATTVLVTWLTVKLRTSYLDFLRTKTLSGALQTEISYFDERGSDEILNAIITQTNYSIELIAYVISIFRITLVSLMYAAIALYIAPLLTITAGLVLGGGVYFIRNILSSGYRVGGEVADANQQVQEVVQAGIQGIRDVKLFVMTDEIMEKFRDSMESYKRARVVQQRNADTINQFNKFTTSVTIFVLIYLAVEIAALSLSSLGVFLFAMFRLGPRLSNLNQLFYQSESHLPHLVRTHEFIEQLETRQERDGTRPVPEPVENVTYDDVRFVYGQGEEDILKGITFTVDRGDFVAFVGPSGAGKSTIVSLLARMYEPTDGRIVADGIPIGEFRLEEWRSRIAFVRQNPFIFNESLRYNVRIGNRDASQEQIDEVCEIAQVTEFIDDLPSGYDTALGDDGVRLSGGQRQRIAIARALLKTDIDLLVLDEATSDLDSHLEEKVHRAIENMDHEYAILAIAHRLSTVVDADCIHMVRNGEIIEEGTHQELLNQNGRYAELYETQSHTMT